MSVAQDNGSAAPPNMREVAPSPKKLLGRSCSVTEEMLSREDMGGNSTVSVSKKKRLHVSFGIWIRHFSNDTDTIFLIEIASYETIDKACCHQVV